MTWSGTCSAGLSPASIANFWTIFPLLDLVSVGLGADLTVFGLSCVRRVTFENFNDDRMGKD